MQPYPRRYASHVTTFFILACALTWGVWLPFRVFGEPGGDLVRIAGTFGPTLAALILITAYDGSAGLVRLLRGLFVWHVGRRWYLLSLLATISIVLASLWLYARLGGASPTFDSVEDWYLIFVYCFTILFLSVLGIGLGGPGAALPRLQGFNTTLISVLLGLAWGIGHAPLFLVEDGAHNSIPFTLFVLQIVALSIIMGGLFSSTRGSLPIVFVVQADSNASPHLLRVPAQPSDYGSASVSMTMKRQSGSALQSSTGALTICVKSVSAKLYTCTPTT